MNGLIGASPQPLSPIRPFRRAVVWLVCLGVFFFASYNGANWVTSLRDDVGSLVFGWERHTPFLPWTIVPYWSIDLLYALSPFLCATVRELDRHALRLLTAQIVAVACFLLFPLRFSFPRPVTDGAFGALFDLLGAFDKPFNQAPSLHIALLVILWAFYLRHTPSWLRPLLHGWFALIGVSVLTTWQHHVIDVPTGAMLGFFALWLWPEDFASPLRPPIASSRRRVLALRYAMAAGVLAVIAIFACRLSLVWFVLWWPVLSLALVGWNYAAAGADGFQKQPCGHHTLAAAILFAPYMLIAFINARLWTWRDTRPVFVRDGVFLGPLLLHGAPLTEAPADGPRMLADMCAELPFIGNPSADTYSAMPSLDLVPVPEDTLRDTAKIIEGARQNGPVHVACALGYSRSAAAVLAWLVLSGRAGTVDEALAILLQARPKAVLRAEQLEIVARMIAEDMPEPERGER